MKLSIIIPAYNEEKYLARTLGAAQEALAPIASSEIIVVDNHSTDGTRLVAARFGVRVVTEHERNISKVRNTGAGNAAGHVYVFIDADTLVMPDLFEKILQIMNDDNCLGGSVDVRYAKADRKWTKYYLMCWQFLGRLLNMRQGAAQFCRCEIFAELGGYDESIFMGEDIEFQWRLSKLARRRESYTAFIENPRVVTSARRFDRMGLWKTLLFTHPITILLARRTRSAWKHWYENPVR
jgi:glycosyltransferase involved in cell wall biosynthesis